MSTLKKTTGKEHLLRQLRVWMKQRLCAENSLIYFSLSVPLLFSLLCLVEFFNHILCLSQASFADLVKIFRGDFGVLSIYRYLCILTKVNSWAVNERAEESGLKNVVLVAKNEQACKLFDCLVAYKRRVCTADLSASSASSCSTVEVLDESTPQRVLAEAKVRPWYARAWCWSLILFWAYLYFW